MSTTFIGSPCSEPARNDTLFGLCDDQDSSKAYSDVEDPESWVAEVINEDAEDVVFTPIDFCIEIFKDNGKDKESTCDGMLTSQNCLYLVELKDKRSSWQSQAKSQIENTINFLKEAHDISGYKYKKAFACNKGTVNFVVIDNEENLRFFRQHGFRLDSNRRIQIK